MPLSFLPKSSQVPKDSQASTVKISLWVKVLLLERTSGPHWQVYFFHTLGRERTMENQHPSLLQKLSLLLFSLWRNHGEATESHPICLLSLVTMVCRRDEQHTQINMSHRLVCGLNTESPGTWLELPLPFGVHVLKYFALKTLKCPKCPRAPMHKPSLDVTLVIRGAEQIHGTAASYGAMWRVLDTTQCMCGRGEGHCKPGCILPRDTIIVRWVLQSHLWCWSPGCWVGNHGHGCAGGRWFLGRDVRTHFLLGEQLKRAET